jgi:hypothetical protein
MTGRLVLIALVVLALVVFSILAAIGWTLIVNHIKRRPR